ncbi:hypothetical protein TBLA_0E02070 [Henningerozyma blattae CBS 6284]|uniref:Proteasome assembly chaperone 1 n=1 Tax=Henningerozyma blattae (strain ATCC 34711 / CBS 6284 / DSM 70876 / NBRC 10599 / NRRL Y-10934 / UCD 77-7) TaxID=1071380 RepID=I2H4F8_HENB6|nr:hypothetical protein TBLA_0E02070 [Tetrapisispora blattae CBS 6284]CCH61260.1 hypothetical protein TBLA_0E02070 [Tetrapisispora blattae CBS 6284]
MLFKQWDEWAEPRHHVDSLAAIPPNHRNADSLQEAPLPLVKVPDTLQDITIYEQIIVATRVLMPLFPKEILNFTSLGNIEVKLNVSEATAHLVKTPIYKCNERTLIIIVDENVMQVCPIFLNVISKTICTMFGNQLKFLIFGTSDRISKIKTINHLNCTLIPPEFITGFIGSIISDLSLTANSKFNGFLVPSEGPLGFEKLTLETMEFLIKEGGRIVKTIDSNLNLELYEKECYRNWRLTGTTIGTQSGLYI